MCGQGGKGEVWQGVRVGGVSELWEGYVGPGR